VLTWFTTVPETGNPLGFHLVETTWYGQNGDKSTAGESK